MSAPGGPYMGPGGRRVHERAQPLPCSSVAAVCLVLANSRHHLQGNLGYCAKAWVSALVAPESRSLVGDAACRGPRIAPTALDSGHGPAAHAIPFPSTIPAPQGFPALPLALPPSPFPGLLGRKGLEVPGCTIQAVSTDVLTQRLRMEVR